MVHLAIQLCSLCSMINCIIFYIIFLHHACVFFLILFFFPQRDHKVWRVYSETLVMLLTKIARDPATTVSTPRIPTSLRIEEWCYIWNNQLDSLVDNRARGKHSSALSEDNASTSSCRPSKGLCKLHLLPSCHSQLLRGISRNTFPRKQTQTTNTFES